MAVTVLATPCAHQPEDPRPVLVPTGPDIFKGRTFHGAKHYWSFFFVGCQSVDTVPIMVATVSPTGRYSVWVTAAS